MIDAESCEILIKQYYKEIYNYCYAKLRYNHHSAEDCTQEVFVTFFSKNEKLNETANIRLWLYRTADNVIKAYLRKSDLDSVSLEESSEAYNIPDEKAVFSEEQESPLDILTEEEQKILRIYYGTDYGDKKAAARKLGLSLPALYQKVHKIKQKLKNDYS